MCSRGLGMPEHRDCYIDQDTWLDKQLTGVPVDYLHMAAVDNLNKRNDTC